MQYLFAGENAIQQCVEEDVLSGDSIAILRGKVTDSFGTPLPLVTVSVDSHPEYVYTTTDNEGIFSLAVNGGDLLTVNYEKENYMPTQRQATSNRRDFVWVSDVAMLTPEQGDGLLIPQRDETQAVQSRVSSDASGNRQALVIFPENTTVSMTLPNCVQQVLDNQLSVTATEYTVGDRGVQAMPLPLPQESAYTYAIDLNFEQAIAANARRVDFNQPLPVYVDNFLNFPVGMPVPAGWYDETQNTWIPSDNGQVVQILRIENNLAVLDVEGNGQPSDANSLANLQITDSERNQLALYYPDAVNRSFWRVLVDHFTPWDFNWPRVAPSDAIEPPEIPPENEEEQKPEDSCIINDASFIEVQTQTLGETIPVAGTDFNLVYRSDRVVGRKSSYHLDIPLYDTQANLPNSLKRVELTITIAGQRIDKIFAKDQLPEKYSFTWDGKDAFGRVTQGQYNATVTVAYIYDGFYEVPSRVAKSFGVQGDGSTTAIPAREEFKYEEQYKKQLGLWDSRSIGLGGMTLSAHHNYDSQTNTVYFGSGTQKEATFISSDEYNLLSSSDDTSTRSRKDIQVINEYGVLSSTSDTDILLDNSYFHISHCTDDCGNILIGSAKIFPDSLKLLYFYPPLAPVLTDMEHGGIVPYPYSLDYDSSIEYTLQNPLRSFSPFLAPTSNSASFNYVVKANYPSLNKVNSQKIYMNGYGVSDDVENPALTLDVQVEGSRTPLQPPVEGAAQCLASENSGNLVFTVTPQVNPALLPTDIKPVEHILVELQVTEKNTNCSQLGSAFTDNILTPTNTVLTDYFYAIEKDSSACQRNYEFITSINKPFQIMANNLRNTEGGFVEYGFKIRGHYDELNHAKWLESHKQFHLVSINNNFRRATRRACSATPFKSSYGYQGMIASPDGSMLYEFDYGLHVRTFDSVTGQVLYNFEYNEAGYLIGITDINQKKTKIERDANQQLIAIVAPYGQRTEFTLDANGFISSAVVVNTETEIKYGFIFTPDGLLTQFTNPNNQSSKYAYNELGLLVKATHAAGGGWSLQRQWLESAEGQEPRQRYTTNLVSAEQRSSSHQVGSGVEGNEYKKVNVSATGVTSSTSKYDNEESRQVVTTQANGTIITINEGFDPRFSDDIGQRFVPKKVTVTTPSGLTNVTQYLRQPKLADKNDPLSLTSLVDNVDVNGLVTSSIYDKAAQTLTVTTPAKRSAISYLDTAGRVIKQSSAGVFDTTYVYDADGRLSSVTESEGENARITTIAYDDRNNIASITNPLGQQVRFVYDSLDRLIKQVLLGEREVAYSYDANGNVTSITPPERNPHTFSYDAIGQQVQYIPPVIVNIPSSQTQSVYNLDKQLVQAIHPDQQQTNFNYNPTTGRLDSIAMPHGNQTYAYDATSGQLTTITASADNTSLQYAYDGFLPVSETWVGEISGVVNVSYDNHFRVTNQNVNNAAQIAYAYDADSLLTQAGDLALTYDAQTGFLTSTQLGGFTTQRTYNPFGELDAVVGRLNDVVLYWAQYQYDKLGRIAQKAETVNGQSHIYNYGYDVAGRLISVSQDSVVTHTYAYDANGNRIPLDTLVLIDYYDAQDRLLHYGANQYTYTTNGELASKSTTKVNTTDMSDITNVFNSRSTSTNTYDYDVLGNLRSVQLGNGQQIEYVIDERNRRIGKKVNGQLVQGFLYQDDLNPVAELDAQGNVMSVFVYGSKINVPDYMVKAGVLYRIVSDHLGSVRLVVDVATGAVVQQLDYDAFGQVLSDTNPSFQPFGFAGGLYDADTGLVRFGARDYDAEVGRWTAKDPIGFDGGDSNFYVYAHNSPNNFFDILGLSNKGMKRTKVNLQIGSDVVEAGKGCVSNVKGASPAYKRELTNEERLEQRIRDMQNGTRGHPFGDIVRSGLRTPIDCVVGAANELSPVPILIKEDNTAFSKDSIADWLVDTFPNCFLWN
nr:RHS repeat-associated core domain-containing protein [Thiotrichaceae bacterium]